MSVKKNLYNEESIKSLSPLEFTRLRPGVYVGSTEYSTQLLIEIVSNAVDEFKAGHGDTITVNILKDNVVTVEDNGQGFIPNAMREDGKTILEASFSVLNTSGKYTEDGVYEGTALGLNGIGSKLAVYLSNHAEITSWRDGQYEHIWFEEGIFKKRDIGKWNNANKPSGTVVTWKPSAEFFNNVEVDLTVIKKLFKVISCLCPGLKIILNGEVYFSKNGLSDLVDEAVKDKEILNNRLNISYGSGKNKIDLVLTYTDSYSSTIIPYVNTGLTDSGPHISQLKTILTRELNKFFREKNWLKEKEENLSGDDCQEGLYLVFNITAPGVSYDAQTKSRIVKLDMKPFNTVIAEELHLWFEKNEKEIKLLADKALKARKAREAAKKARDSIREPKDKKAKLVNLPTKLVDCWSKNRLDCELLISEGDSAASGLIGARDSSFQAVFPIRGKILNCFKAETSKIFANQEIVNIIKALGLEIDPKTNKPIYDKNKLRYGKILMCCDADADGEAIKNLLLTCFWWLCPELLLNGHVYAAIPPLFRITTKKNEYIYLRDAAALEEYKLAHKGEKFQINRNKGLGEQDPDELEECLLNPSTRNVAQITVADEKEAYKMLDILMGSSVAPRKEYILNNAEDAVV
jgi:DNA gyrase subunit B